MKTKSISNKRLIKGHFEEVQRSNEFLKEKDNYAIKIESVEEKGLLLSSEHFKLKSEVFVSFCIGGDYFNCTLKSLENNLFEYPKEISQIERRKEERIYYNEISTSNIVCTIESLRSKEFGFLYNLNSNYISITVNEDCSDFDINDLIRVVVYLDNAFIGDYNGKIISKTNENQSLNILAKIVIPNSHNENKRKRINKRGHKIEKTPLKLFWPNQEGFSFNFMIREISGLGLSGTLPEEIKCMLPIGTLFEEHNTRSRLKLTWRDHNNFGFDLSYSPAWQRTKLINSIGAPQSSNSKLKKSSKSLSLLTRAGLVKGGRSLSYQNESKQEIFLNRSRSTNRWHHFVDLGEESNLSFLRYTDDAWMIQELASVSQNPARGKNIVLHGINKFLRTNTENNSSLLTLFGINDAKNTFVNKIWTTVFPSFFENGVYTYQSFIFSIKNKTITCQNNKYTITKANKSNWVSLFTPPKNIREALLLNTFNIKLSDFKGAILSDILGRENHLFDRSVHAVKNEKNEVSAYTIKVGLPPLSNATSIAENIYILLLKHDLDVIPYILSHIKEISSGLEDVCIITDQPLETTSLENKLVNIQVRPFLFGLLLANQQSKELPDE